MGAEYVFVGVAFIVGLLCASIYHSVRARRSRHGDVSRTQALTTLIHRLNNVCGRDELGAMLLGQLAELVQCDSMALYLRDDVAFRLVASRGLDDARADGLHQQLEGDPNLMTPSKMARVLRLNGEVEYALVVLTSGHRTGVVALHPADVAARPAATSLVEAAGSHALARWEALSLGDELKEAATQDAATRLHNQRYFLELFELEYNRSLRYRRSLAVLLCGVDGSDGEGGGDGGGIGEAALRHVAHAFRGNLRYFDVVGRYENDILAVLLPEATGAAAATVARRLLEAVAAENRIESLSVNVGVACIGEPGGDFKTMLNAAEEALSRARDDGNNRICMNLD